MKQRRRPQDSHDEPVLYVIYDHPCDFPEKFVCRIWHGEQLPELLAVADSLEQVREQLPPDRHCVVSLEHGSTFEQLRRNLLSDRIIRHRDDPVKVEVWV